MIHITTERVRRLLALAMLCALAAVVGLALSGRTDPLHRLVGAVDAHASVTVAAEDAAAITVPPRPDDAGAAVSARVVPQQELPPAPAQFPDYLGAWEFSVEGGIDGAATLRLPAPQVDGAWTLVTRIDGKWELTPFAVEGGTIVVPLSGPQLDLGPVGRWAGAVVGCVGDPGQCVRDVTGALGDCLTNVAKCASVVMTAPWEVTNAFWEAAVEGTRIAFGADSVVYYIVKGSIGTYVEISDAAKEKFREASEEFFSWAVGQPTPIRCRPDDRSIIYAPSTWQEVLDGCAQPASDGSLLRVKNMRRFWVQVCPSNTRNVERHGAFDIFGPLSTCGDDGGTVLAPSAEAAWDADQNAELTLNAYFTWRTALLTVIDSILSAVGVADLGGKMSMVLAVLQSLHQIPEVQNIAQAIQQGRVRDALRRFGHLISHEPLRDKVIDILARSGLFKVLGVHFSADAIKAAVGWSAVVELTLDIANLATLRVGSNGYAGSVSFRSRDTSAPRSEETQQAKREIERVEQTRRASDRTAVEPPTTQRAAPDHVLIRQAGTIDVFLTRIAAGKRFKRLLLNPTVFNSYGFDWQSVRDVSAEEIDRWAHSSLARLEDDYQVWQLFPAGDEGQRRPLDLTDEQFISAGFDWDSVAVINRTEFEAYNEGRSVTAAELGLAGAPPTAAGALRFVADIGDRTLTLREHSGNVILPVAVGGRAPYTYRLSTPPGMRFDPNTRQFGGTPVGLPINRFLTYRATDAAGNTASLEFTLSLIPASLPNPAPSQSARAVAVSVGNGYVCALLDSGAVECWGSGGSRRDAPEGTFSAVSAGGHHTCGLRTGGVGECWGDNGFGQADAPEGTFSAVSTGLFHTCGLRASGAVECWGYNDKGQANAPGGLFSAVSAGSSHTCGLRASGTVKCWGGNDGGQADAPGGSFSAVSASHSHTCGLRVSGAVECWGGNGAGQTNAPGGAFSAVSAGLNHTCGLRASGAVECWGGNSSGQTDAPGGSFSAVSAGNIHTCGLRPNGVVECWGGNDYGQADALGGVFSAVSAGQRHTCGLRASGVIECWGDSWAGQADAPGGSFSAVSAGGHHTCGLRPSGAVECWGANGRGQTDVPGGSFSAVSAGSLHTCGLRPGGVVECWGDNQVGKADAPGGAFSVVSAGSYHTCGLRPSGVIECWGASWAGQADAPGGSFSAVSVGNSHTCGLRPNGVVECWGASWAGEADAPGGSFSAVSVGLSHTCGLRPSGAVECWGYTFDGQAQPPAGRHTAISSGTYHACALSEDGSVACWMIYNGAADVPAWLREPGTAPGSELSPAPIADATSGRIVARLAADGRTEFAWQPTNGERILPRSRYFPTNAQPNRWLRSSPIELNGIELGRINARRLADGRIEFAFTPTDGERILPPSRFFPADAEANRWLRSTEIELNR